MKKLGIDERIAGPIAKAAGIPYAAIEFSQVGKIIPGTNTI